MPDYEYNIKGCLEKYRDTNGASGWFVLAASELSSDAFAQLIKKTLFHYLASYQFDLAELCFKSLNGYVESCNYYDFKKKFENEYKGKQHNEKCEQIKAEYTKLLESYEFEEADVLVEKNNILLPVKE